MPDKVFTNALPEIQRPAVTYDRQPGKREEKFVNQVGIQLWDHF
jgi:hypothetical protein